MRASIVLAVLHLLLTGCTSLALQRHTAHQVASVADLRFQEVMDNFAVVAANPATLPSYAPVVEGSAMVNDSWNFDAKSAWTKAGFKGFSAETLALTGTRSPQPYWTVD